MTTTTIEMVTYQLNDDADINLVNEYQEQINNFCLEQPGFLYRSISKNADIWHDIVYWQDKASADGASQAFTKTEVCQALNQVVKKDSLRMVHMGAMTEAMSAPAN